MPLRPNVEVVGVPMDAKVALIKATEELSVRAPRRQDDGRVVDERAAAAASSLARVATKRCQALV